MSRFEIMVQRVKTGRGKNRYPNRKKDNEDGKQKLVLDLELILDIEKEKRVEETQMLRKASEIRSKTLSIVV